MLQLDAIQHILKRPDSYVGSLESIKQPMWVYDRDAKRMVFRHVLTTDMILSLTRIQGSAILARIPKDLRRDIS